jgi:putative protease
MLGGFSSPSYAVAMPKLLRKPELMSPAGDWPQLQAAIETGADAVYFGLNHFSARAKVGFSLDDLPEVMSTLHARGVQGFVAFNTLVFDHELSQAETAIIAMAQAGVDAVIVQDIGVAKLCRKVAPQLTLHGSTQMSITSAQGAELAASFGCSRVVLGRELSLADIRRIAEATDVELEVFVHGALCVSYSGQCFSSEAWGGRSANRGKCAQACRLSYDLIVDGQMRDLGDARYLLSPGDLYALEQIPELVSMGIHCLKIEGRYKDANYVAATTQAYRQAIDLACLGLPVEQDDEDRLQLEQIYSRGLGAHFMSGTNHQTVVHGRAPRHRGVKVGSVMQVGAKSVTVQIDHDIELGDGLVFDAADWRSPDEPEEGGHVYEVKPIADDLVKLAFEHGRIDFDRIKVGDWVWRSHDPQLIKSLKPITTTEVPLFTRPINFEVTANGGSPIQIVATVTSISPKRKRVDPSHDAALPSDATTGDATAYHTATFIGDHPLEPAAKRPLDKKILQDKLGRLGGTPFHLGTLNLLTNDPVFVQTSVLNQARRQLVDELFDQAGEPQSIPAAPALDQIHRQTTIHAKPAQPINASPQLHVLVRTADQLDGVLDSLETPPASITLDYLELYGLRTSVDKIRDAGLIPRVASPRILKPSEQNVIKFLLSLECPILVRSGGLLFDLIRNADADATPPQLIGDFSLNAANAISVSELLNLGLTRITPTYDLNSQQVTDLTQQIHGSFLEPVIYSQLPVFHTEHCVFCKFLSDGTDNTNCGHPCEKHQVSVRDSKGRAHPVMADVGCRNTVFGAEAQTDSKSLKPWLESGIRDFRIEFVHHSTEQVTNITKAYQNFFNDNLSTEQLDVELIANSPQGITEGSLYVPADYQELVQLN